MALYARNKTAECVIGRRGTSGRDVSVGLKTLCLTENDMVRWCVSASLGVAGSIAIALAIMLTDVWLGVVPAASHGTVSPFWWPWVVGFLLVSGSAAVVAGIGVAAVSRD